MIPYITTTAFDIESVIRQDISHRVTQEPWRYGHLCSSFFEFSGDLPAAINTLGSNKLERSHETDTTSLYMWVFESGALLFAAQSGLNKQQITLYVAGPTPEFVSEFIERAKNILSSPKKEDKDISLRFWSHGPNGASNYIRKFSVSPWNTTQDNYPPSTRDSLTALMNIKSAPATGHLILFYGIPGVGKTTSLLSLMHEWRKWASFNYISDTEKFFGDMTYINQVILSSVNQYDWDDDEEFIPLRRRNVSSSIEKKANLVIIEDADELIASDAKERTGQALSKLLNITDGLIGRGTNTLILITTNEPLGRIHPAVKRPGRCLAELEFASFSELEAEAWATARNVTLPRRKSFTLAELYAHISGEVISTKIEKKGIGFNA